MSLVINHNLVAMNAARNLGTAYDRLAVSTQRLSSGLRINSAADDAAGLAVREMQRADIAVLNQGVRNAGDAINMIQTAEGALSVIDEKLIRMKELAEQAATGTYTAAQRQIMEDEYDEMSKEITRIATATDFNGTALLNGSLSDDDSATAGMKIHFGTGNDSAQDYYYITIEDMTAETLGVAVGGGSQASVAAQAAVTSQGAVGSMASRASSATGTSLASQGAVTSQGAVASQAAVASRADIGGAGSVASQAAVTSQASVAAQASVASRASGTGTSYASVAAQAAVPSQAAVTSQAEVAATGVLLNTQTGAQQALGKVDSAISTKDTTRAKLGAMQNRLENTMTNLVIQAENTQAAESRISDVDVATEMTEFTRNNILAQSATAMLTQANSLPRLALQLLGG